MDWSLREGNASVTHVPTAIHSFKLIVITLCPSLLTSVFVIFTYLNVFPKTTGPIVTKLDSNVTWLVLGVVFHFHSILKFNMVARTSYALWLVKTSNIFFSEITWWNYYFVQHFIIWTLTELVLISKIQDVRRHRTIQKIIF